jgi:hypothetical protein
MTNNLLFSLKDDGDQSSGFSSVDEGAHMLTNMELEHLDISSDEMEVTPVIETKIMRQDPPGKAVGAGLMKKASTGGKAQAPRKVVGKKTTKKTTVEPTMPNTKEFETDSDDGEVY